MINCFLGRLPLFYLKQELLISRELLIIIIYYLQKTPSEFISYCRVIVNQLFKIWR